MDGISTRLPDPATLRPGSMKGYEDAIDALICCWVGAEFLMGRAKPYGDTDAAIWIP
jgi:hypothetical protein